MTRSSNQSMALLVSVVLGSLWTNVRAFPTFPAAIPNGVNVPCPSHFDETQSAEQCALDICKGVGHVDCRGGDFPDADGEILNAFGRAFQAAGRQWTTELCNEDSDGDGKTNGQELGDPCCVWRPSALSTVGEDYRISHPGHAEDVTDSDGPTPAECQALKQSLGAATAFDEVAWADEVYLDSEPRSNLTFRVQEHALLPNETIYTRAYFPLPQDQDYYIVGFLADIVNKIHVHHFVVTFCTEPVSELYNNPNSEPGFPEQPVDERDLGFTPASCLQNLYNWAPGADTVALPDHMAIKFGRNTEFKALFLEIHYNNPEQDTDATDSSGFTALITTQPREHEATWWWTGSIIDTGDIPPGKQSYFNTAECTVQLKPECDHIYTVGYAPHAHFLGISIWTELYRPDALGNLQYVRDLGREEEFHYELQYMRMFNEEHAVRSGDVVVATCIYDSMDRTEPTPGGLGSQEEMCINLILAYPSDCLYSQVCISAGRIVSGDVPDGVTTPYQNPNLYPLGGSPNYTAVLEQELATCNTEAVFNNSLMGPSGNPEERMFVSFSEACPGLLDLEGGDDSGQESDDATAGDNFYTPASRLAYNCSDACVDWMINFGVCTVSELKPYDQILASGGVAPTALAPPSCFAKVTQQLTERSGGTYTPVQASEIVSSNPTSIAASGGEADTDGDAAETVTDNVTSAAATQSLQVRKLLVSIVATIPTLSALVMSL